MMMCRFLLLIFLFNSYITLSQSWQIVKSFNPEQTLHSVDFLDGLTGYTVGALYNNSNFNIHRTTDGGKTWVDQNSGYTGMRFMKIWYQDRDICYMSSNDGIIIKTIDAGLTWKTLKTGTTEQIWGLYFTDKNTGYACGSRGLLMKTIDAGETWEILPNPKINLLQSIFFIDKNIGLAAGSNILLRTADAGVTWTEVKNFPYKAPADWLRKIVFPTSSIGYACADIGRIYKTTDAGESWVSLESGVQEALMDMDFVDENIGLAVGFNGTILKTVDGGLNWTLMPSPAGIDHNFGIDMVDQNLAFICTHRGKILKIQNLTSIKEIEITNLDIYPNPCSDFIQLTDVMQGPSSYKIYTSDGKEVLSQELVESKNTKISVSILPKGAYIIHLIQNDKMLQSRFVKM